MYLLEGKLHRELAHFVQDLVGDRHVLRGHPTDRVDETGIVRLLGKEGQPSLRRFLVLGLSVHEPHQVALPVIRLVVRGVIRRGNLHVAEIEIGTGLLDGGRDGIRLPDSVRKHGRLPGGETSHMGVVIDGLETRFVVIKHEPLVFGKRFDVLRLLESGAARPQGFLQDIGVLEHRADETDVDHVDGPHRPARRGDGYDPVLLEGFAGRDEFVVGLGLDKAVFLEKILVPEDAGNDHIAHAYAVNLVLVGHGLGDGLALVVLDEGLVVQGLHETRFNILVGRRQLDVLAVEILDFLREAETGPDVHVRGLDAQRIRLLELIGRRSGELDGDVRILRHEFLVQGRQDFRGRRILPCIYAQGNLAAGLPGTGREYGKR